MIHSAIIRASGSIPRGLGNDHHASHRTIAPHLVASWHGRLRPQPAQRRHRSQRATSCHRTPATKAPAPGDSTNSPAGRAGRGRHTVPLKTVDPSRRTIRFDLLQFYGGDDALRGGRQDHPRPRPSRSSNGCPTATTSATSTPGCAPCRCPPTRHHRHHPRLGQQPQLGEEHIPVTLTKLATYMPTGAPFSITVRHGQVVKLAEISCPNHHRRLPWRRRQPPPATTPPPALSIKF